MICCGIGAVAIATAVVRRRPWKLAGARISLAATLAVVAASITLLGLAAQHFGHYVGRARANERSLVAEIMAQPGAFPAAMLSISRQLTAVIAEAERGKPGLRHDYGPNYYAAFAIDPDGYRIEAYCNKEG